MKIVVYTIGNVASTLVANVVTEIFEPGEPVNYIEHVNKQPGSKLIDKIDSWKSTILQSSRTTFKCHGDIQTLQRIIERTVEDDIVYVYVYRESEEPLPKLVKSFNPVSSRYVLLQYHELLYNSNYTPESKKSRDQVVKYIAENLNTVASLPDNYSTKTVTKRVYEMDDRYKQIKTKTWGYVDPYYQIHGSHRKLDRIK